MRICLVTFDFPPIVGGISTLSYDLTSHLSREGIEVHVLAAGKEDEEDYSGGLFKVTRLKVPLNSKLRKIPTFQFRVWRWLRDNGRSFDIIHFQEAAGFIYFSFNLFNKTSKNNTIEHFHHSQIAEFLFHLKFLFKMPRESLPYLLIPLSTFQEYLSLKRAKQIITVSNSSRSTLISWGINPSKIAVIPNALSESSLKDRREGIPQNGAIKFLSVGRLVPRKGVDILIEAINILSKRGINNFHVDIIGQGLLFEYCQRVIRKNNLENCHMWGQIPQHELDELYREADCFICPSRLEGFGIVLLEAAANNLAVIANDITVFREIYSANEALYFKRDDPEDLAEKMSMLINDPGLISVLQAKGRDRLENYNWQNVVKDYIDMYSKMLREPNKMGGCA